MEKQNICVLHVKLMIVDDNQEDINLVKNFLIPKGYEVVEAYSGEEALKKVKESKPDIVVLDWLLPGMQGIDVCREIKTQFPTLPVLMLSIHTSTEHKVQAFHHGCDDYLAKPCELEELEIRLQNLLKRSGRKSISEKMIRLGDIVIDRGAHRATKAGSVVELTIKEYALLEYLLTNANKVLTRNMILEHVWGENSETFTNIVDVYVNYLRKKLDTPLMESYIKTVRAVGYMAEEAAKEKKAA